MDVIGVLITTLVELVFFGGGIYTFVATLLASFRGNNTYSWTTVEGIIISTRIDEHENTDYESGYKSIDYLPVINYSYEFGGVQYSSNRVSFEEDPGWVPINDKRKAKERLSRYPKDMRIRVYCNPKKPQQSTLQPGFREERIILNLCISLVLVGIAMALFFFYTLPEMSKYVSSKKLYP